MISGDVMRGFNDLLILSILSKEDSYGYKVSQIIKDFSGGLYIMKETTLYSAFNRLEKKELIQSYSSSESFGKPRTYYRITSSGIEAYMEKLVEWEQVKHIIDRFTKEEEKKDGHHS